MAPNASQEHASTNGNDIENAQDGNSKPLAKTKNDSFFSRGFIFGPIDKKHCDLILLAHSVATGMVDAACFSNWGVFAGMQTGNTVLLGLSTATSPNNPHAWLTTLISIISYLLGAFVTFRLTIFLVPQGVSSNRTCLFTILMAQALLILISAALIAADIVPHNAPGVATAANVTAVIDNIRIVSLLPPLAFQAGIQIATSRLLGYNELPVNVVTSTYCDIMGDNALLRPHNTKRNRRLAAVALVLIGAVASGWLMRSAGGLQSALFLAGGIKFIVAVAAFAFLKRDKGEGQ
ncbi:hypothetical protein C1H76_5715 [Elsinoe australis]|uniref:DUF1275 domain protein n=1 Tax=Elsinoe australis TaxID=40998 RepID=A0A4V6DTV0_9PEZI|nr:hypothetical protein C1H76_5715 [Elsinoe australis]